MLAGHFRKKTVHRKNTKTVFLLESSGLDKFCLQRRCRATKESSSASIIINEVRSADIYNSHSVFTPFVDNSVIIISRNMKRRACKQCSFMLVEICSRQNRKQIEKNWNCTIQFSFLKLRLELNFVCWRLVCLRNIMFFFFCHHEKAMLKTQCLKHFSKPLSSQHKIFLVFLICRFAFCALRK